METISVCSHGPDDFRVLTAGEWLELRSAVDVLIFSSVAPQTRLAVIRNNRSWGPPSANRFELITQNFQVGDDHVAVRAGSLLSAGYQLGQITFPEPWAMGGGLFDYDKRLLDGFNKVFEPAFPAATRDRLFRSLEWFRLAHMEGAEVSDLSRIVMLATAFEILLQFPQEGKRQHFIKYAESVIASPAFKTGVRMNPRGKSFTYSLAGCWASDFYELRSKIVHGDAVTSTEVVYKDWITQFVVADMVFWECMVRTLFDHGCLGDDVRSCAKDFDKLGSGTPSCVDTVIRSFLGFEEMHGALGWLP
ncbi:MAG TPA: hypothetical protein VE398_00565 [Acidobacteriota bacterium]|nr:hypothetical protein [Acidobacteriota bacterium]